MKILLIAGHGGNPYDPGAVGCGTKEAIETRVIVNKLKAALSAYVDVSVFDIALNAFEYLKKNTFNFKGYDVVYEIHLNAGVSERSANGVSTGAEIIVSPKKQSTKVEKQILNNLALLGFKNRGVKTSTGLRNLNICTQQGVPYALIEVCFIDDIDDMRIYYTQQDNVIKQIADGIISGYSLQKDIELTTPNDIVWELAHRGFVTDSAGMLKELTEHPNSRLYWMCRKFVNYLKKIN